VILLSSHFFAIAQAQAKAGNTGAPPPMVTQEVAIFGLVLVGFLFIGIPLMLGIFSIAFAALTSASTEIARGQKVTIRGSYGYAFRHFWRHVGVLFLQTLFAGVIPYFVFGALVVIVSVLAALASSSGTTAVLAPLLVVLLVAGVIALFFVCVLIWLRVSLAFPVSVAENQKAWPSIKRSNLLSKGTRGRIFVMFLLVMVLSIVASMALMIPMDLVIGFLSRKSITESNTPTTFLMAIQVVNLFAGFLVRIFVMPIYTTALVVFYLDQRTRIEGYDIELLMAQAGWSELPAPMATIAETTPGLSYPADAHLPPFPSQPPSREEPMSLPKEPDSESAVPDGFHSQTQAQEPEA
jgi:hypothetical protein